MRRTIPELFRGAVGDAPAKVWLYSDAGELTYAQALARVERAASGLRGRGIGTGDRVLVTAPNTADVVLSWLALMEVGAIQVPINPASSETEIAGFVQQVEPTLIADAREIAAWFDAEPDGRGPADVDPADVAVMIPTSGTTGRSKLVMQTHLAYVMAGEGFPYWMQLTADDRLLTTLPLFHINAPAYSTLGSIAARASLVLRPGFSASSFLDDARRFGATQFNAIGAMLEILMRQPARADDADNPLRRCYTGPAPERERHLGDRGALRHRDRLRVRAVGVAVRARSGGTVNARTERSARPVSIPSSATSTTRAWSTPTNRSGPRSVSARSASSSCATR